MEQTRAERRSPDRQRFAVLLLRRLALLCLLLAAALWVVPRVLVRQGVLGPDAAQSIQTASSALQTARAYGARDEMPELRRALQELDAARALLAEGRALDARDRADDATAAAIEAQRRALITQAGDQNRARAVYEDLDRELLELETLYDAATEGLAPPEKSRLFSMMKATRVATGAVFLAYEEGDYERALGREPSARAAIRDARERLEAARKR